ncbi:MAG: glycoside hydrolase family 31 protein [Myxococcales bacterium]|nr:glycoside hydrolase family 31 protein [Myxococcales bacterium]
MRKQLLGALALSLALSIALSHCGNAAVGPDASAPLDIGAVVDTQSVDSAADTSSKDVGTGAGWASWWDGAGDPKAGIVVTKEAQVAQVAYAHGEAKFVLRVDGPAKLIELTAKSDTTPRARLDVSKWQLGRVKTFDPKVNYNPTNLADSPPTDLYWCAVTHLTQIYQPHPTGEQGFAGTFWLLKTAAAGQPCPDYTLHIQAQQDSGYSIDIVPLSEYSASDFAAGTGSEPVVYLRIAADAPADEGYYGIGELFDTPQHRGQVRALQLEGDFNLDGSSNEGHVRVPLLVGTHGWGLFAKSYRAGSFDVAATDKSQIVLTMQTSGLALWVLVSAKPIDIVSRYWKLTGNPLLPARWAVGGLLWRNENKDQAEVLQDAADLRQHDLALSGLWIDRPYDKAVNDFGFDPKMFSDPKAMITALHKVGLRVGLWSTPYFDPGYGDKLKSKHFDFAKSNDYFVHGAAAWSTILKWGPPVDFTNSKARDFFKGLVKQYTDMGIEGFKMDYGEDIVLGIANARLEWTFADGSDERTMHQAYQLGYHEAYASQLPKPQGQTAKTGGGWLLCRKSTWGDQTQASMIWPGDLCAGWVKFGECTADGECHAGGLPASVAAAISLPTAGFPLYGADTGGYRHGRAPKELFLRWLQHTALTAVLQIGGGSDHHPWLQGKANNSLTTGGTFDEETLTVSRQLIRLHARLFPLIWTDMVATQGPEPRGVGPVRALGLMYPQLSGDAGLRAHEADQWFLGEHLLVAPVITPKLEREVWLPPGQWVDWFDGSLHDGGASGKLVTLTVPLAKLPLYVRVGAPVPLLRPTIDTLAPSTDPVVDSFANNAGPLWIRAELAGGWQADGALSAFDGTAVKLSGGGKALTIQFTVKGSEFNGVVLDIGGVAQVSVVAELLVAGQTVPQVANSTAVAQCTAACWHYDSTSKRLTMRMISTGQLQVGGN